MKSTKQVLDIMHPNLGMVHPVPAHLHTACSLACFKRHTLPPLYVVAQKIESRPTTVRKIQRPRVTCSEAKVDDY